VNEQAIDEALVGDRIQCAVLELYEDIVSRLELPRDTEVDMVRKWTEDLT
jgi:hypothetical protein